MAKITLTVNGAPHAREVEDRTLLVDLLRDHLGLTGTHVGCDTSQCGCCTVHLNGRAVKSCTMLAAQAEGADIVTIEGLAKGETILAKDLPPDVLSPRKPVAAFVPPEAYARAGTDSVAVPAAGIAGSYDAIYRQLRLGDGRNILGTIELDMIRRAMEETRGNQLRSALILGINRSTLKKRLNEMREAGIKVFT
jgi:hypothetical protein